MGRSNEYVFPWYVNRLPNRQYQRVAALGATGPDAFTRTIDCESIDFFDLTLNNWKINDDVWPEQLRDGRYDLVICTRCPYFAEDPVAFLKKCREATTNGTIFLDWGLGDHWRQQPFKIGWRRDGYHEEVTYGEHISRLYSTAWRSDLDRHDATLRFMHACGKVDPYYVDKRVSRIIKNEVPAILDLDVVKPTIIDLLMLWPEQPQLNILTVFDDHIP